MSNVITNAQTGEVTVVEFTPEEIAIFQSIALEESWEVLRKERDILLSSSDWTQVADAPVNQLVWAEYRQALRDLPQNTTDPANPVWPQKPE